MEKTRRPLSVRDVAALLTRSEHSREAILVGGQALNIWAIRFRLATESAAVSADIDFFGSRALAIAAGLDWEAEVRTPSLDDHTPNSAVVLVDIDEEEHGIDFLNSILGVDSEELQRWSLAVRGRDYAFRVMHPLHVLQSQMENVYGVLGRRSEKAGKYYADRVALAVQVVSKALQELLKEKRTRDALNAAERIAELAMKRPALEAFGLDELDVLAAIPRHPAWPVKFMEQRLPQIHGLVNDKRRKYTARKSRATPTRSGRKK